MWLGLWDILSVFCAPDYREKEELKEMWGHKITKWLKIEKRELGLVATNQCPVAGAETERV